MRIKLTWPQGEATGVLQATPTAQKVWDALPFSGRANTWGEEVYFTIPVQAEREADAQQVVEPGTICFWPDGDALALPFGPTPISDNDQPKLASACNILGTLEGDPRVLASVKSGDTVDVTRSET